jgi:hypothetical protein
MPTTEVNLTVRIAIKREQDPVEYRASTGQPSGLTERITSFVGKLWAGGHK